MSIKLLTSPSSWIEGEALRQLQVTSELPGMISAIGLPDLHPGRGHPVGAVFLSKDIIYPYLIGSDIGCGMSLYATGMLARKAKRDRWVKSLNIDGIWQDDQAKDELLAKHQAPDTYRNSIGTIGLGNHFAELLTVEDVKNDTLDKKMLYLLVHSGSRGLGDEILRSHTEKFGAKGLAVSSGEAQAYLEKHDGAVKWAKANREAIAIRLAEAIGLDITPILDLCHNSVTCIDGCWCHRKGATPHSGLAVVPGSRGSLSYLVAAKGNPADFGYSLPHGAGRKWNRSDAKARLKDRYLPTELVITSLGSSVICEDKDLLYEEAPEAYKNISSVIADMEEHKMAEVVGTFKPLITYKMRNSEY
jgi:release factor H-coupled RctB family protein